MNVLEFYDRASARHMGLTVLDSKAWLVYKHPDGQWVTEREATDEDMGRIVAFVGWPAEDQEAAR